MNNNIYEEILQMEKKMWEAAKNKNPIDFLRVVEPEAVMVCGGFRCTGQQYSEIVSVFDCKSYQIENFEVVHEEEKSVQVHYVIQIEVNDEKNSDLAGEFHITTTWAKKENGWKVVYNMDHKMDKRVVKGIHHVSLTCSNQQEFQKEIEFYRDIFGMQMIRQWETGVMFETGSGFIEIFNNGDESLPKGTIRHFALATDNIDALANEIQLAGYEVFIEPRDIAFSLDENAMKARIAFCRGPLGEEIELFFEN